MVRTLRYIVPLMAAGMICLWQTPARGEEDAGGGTGTVSGTVVDKDGKAVQGATVRLITPPKGGVKQKKSEPGEAKQKDGPGEPGRADRPRPNVVGEATTGADGKFTLANVPAGNYMIGSRMKGVGHGHQKVSLKAGDTVTVALTLQPGRPGADRGEHKGHKHKGKDKHGHKHDKHDHDKGEHGDGDHDDAE